MGARVMVRALCFTLSAVALTLVTVAPGSWDDPSREAHPPGTGEPTEHTSFLAPAAVFDPRTQQAEGVPREFYFSRDAGPQTRRSARALACCPGRQPRGRRSVWFELSMFDEEANGHMLDGLRGAG